MLKGLPTYKVTDKKARLLTAIVMVQTIAVKVAGKQVY
jgi:hypothetical protein